MMFYAYFACFLLGFGFVAISALLSGLSGGHGDSGHDAGGHEVGHEVELGHDAGDFSAGEGGEVGHGHGSAGPAEGAMHLPLFSPLVIACFLASFGGSGMLFQKLLGDQLWLHAPLAAGTSLITGSAIAFAIWKLTSTFNSHRNARVTDALGILAEVSVTVPKQGMGEIAYVSGNTRQTLTARSADGREFKQGTSVKVLRIDNGIALVGEPPPGMVAVGAPVTEAEPTVGEPIRDREQNP
ncbi:MAG: hypothetical protein HY901_23095 [Deltaproteobacteria bacterium]|nr:hypothetical protein [Deltaproteobacteria bacterium]